MEDVFDQFCIPFIEVNNYGFKAKISAILGWTGIASYAAVSGCGEDYSDVYNDRHSPCENQGCHGDPYSDQGDCYIDVVCGNDMLPTCENQGCHGDPYSDQGDCYIDAGCYTDCPYSDGSGQPTPLLLGSTLRRRLPPSL